MKPTGISPSHGSHVTLLIACDAFNARTVTVREYHYAHYTSSPIEFLSQFPGSMFLALPKKGVMAHLSSWLVVVGKLSVPLMLHRRYLACFLCQRANYSFGKKEPVGRRQSTGYLLNLEGKNSFDTLDNQFIEYLLIYCITGFTIWLHE